MNPLSKMEISINQDQNSFAAFNVAQEPDAPLQRSQGMEINFNEDEQKAPARQINTKTFAIAQRFRNNATHYTILPLGTPTGLEFPLAKDLDDDYISLICFDIPQVDEPKDTLLIQGDVDPRPPSDPHKRRRFSNPVPVDQVDNISAYSLDGVNAFIPSLKRAIRISNHDTKYQGTSFPVTLSMTVGSQSRPSKLEARAGAPTPIKPDHLSNNGPLAKLLPKPDFIPDVPILNQLSVTLGITHCLGLPDLEHLNIAPLPPISPPQIQTSWLNNRATNHIDLEKITSHLPSPATILIASAPSQNQALKQALCYFFNNNPRSKHSFHILTYIKDQMHFTPSEFVLTRKNPIFKPPHLQAINLLGPNLLTKVMDGQAWVDLSETPRDMVRFAMSHFSALQTRNPTASAYPTLPSPIHK